MLLTIEASSRLQEAPRKIRVTPDSASSIRVRQGQLLKITALGSGATASLFGFVKDQPFTFLSVHHTRVFSNSYVLGIGMRLVTNRRRPLMVLGKDTIGTHDLLMPASTTAYLKECGITGHQGCVEAVQTELQRCSILPPRLPDPINLFMNVPVHLDGRLEPLPSRVAAGDHVVFRVLHDATFVVASCCTGIAGNNAPAELALDVAEDLPGLQ